MKKLGKFFLFVFLFLIVAVGAVAGYAWYNLQAPGTAENQVECKIDVVQGTTIRSVSKELESRGIIRSADLLYLLARKNGSVVKSGTYTVNSAMTPSEILELLASGQQEYISVSIPEGFTVGQIGALLETKGIVSKEAFVSMTKDVFLLEKYGIPGPSFEGYLFPDTYYFNRGMDCESIISMMVDNFFKKIESIDGLKEKKPAELFYIVRLASVVEREYRVADEAPIIASVFTNRLNAGAGLYSCATVVYMLTEVLGRPHPDRVLTADTKIDNPYNTYVHAGLPPGAISNPGLIALRAAAHPAETDYWFFVVEDEAAGRHVFTENLEDHNQAKYNLSVKRAAGN